MVAVAGKAAHVKFHKISQAYAHNKFTATPLNTIRFDSNYG